MAKIKKGDVVRVRHMSQERIKAYMTQNGGPFWAEEMYALVGKKVEVVEVCDFVMVQDEFGTYWQFLSDDLGASDDKDELRLALGVLGRVLKGRCEDAVRKLLRGGVDA